MSAGVGAEQTRRAAGQRRGRRIEEQTEGSKGEKKGRRRSKEGCEAPKPIYPKVMASRRGGAIDTTRSTYVTQESNTVGTPVGGRLPVNHPPSQACPARS